MKYTWILAVLVGAAACVSPDAHRKLIRDNETLRGQIADLSAQHALLAESYQRLESRNQELGARAADADWIDSKKAEISDLLKRYEAGSPSAVPGVQVIKTGEGYAFRVAGGVLFASGQNELSEQGKRTLDELTRSLAGHRLRIEGHTDDQPILRSRWGTNLRLSVERAMSVSDYLTTKAGIPSDSVSVAGYGEFWPAVEGVTEEARSTNRRVEILMLDRRSAASSTPARGAEGR